MRIRRSYLLAAAFSALLVVIGVSAYAVWHNAMTAQSRVAALQNAHMRAGSALSSIRANVYLIGILTRDYLLDPDPAQAPAYTSQFRQIQAATDRAFHLLESSGQEAAQRDALQKLRRELDLYWDPTEMMLDWTPEQKRARRYYVLRQSVRRREEIFALAGQVEKLMSDNFARERQRITNADRDFRSSLGWITGASLLLSIGIVLVTFVQMRRLEEQSLAAESELRDLSGQLRTAQEQERRYLSRELHDQVGQMLTGLRMELANIARLHGNAESELAAHIAHAKGTVEQTLRVVRNIAMLLRPSMLDDLGLTPALAWHMKEFSRASGIEIQSDIDPAVDSLPDAHRTCLYRLIQEALTNCARHSRATKVEVTVKVQDGWVQGCISDNGCGFTASSSRPKGIGLLGMEERVRELKGVVRFVSSPGRGARVEIRLPRPGETEVTDDSHPDRGRSRDRSDRVKASA
jgi:signal transduction histidine kinase